MYGSLQKIFDKLDAFAKSKRQDFISFNPFTIAFYGARKLVEGELIPELERLSLDRAFRADIFSLYMIARHDERRLLEADLSKRPGDRATELHYAFRMEVLRPKLLAPDFNAMVELMNSEFVEYTGYLEVYDNIHTEFHGCSGEQFIAESFSWYQIGLMLFGRWTAEKDRVAYIEQHTSQEVFDEYARIDMNIRETDPQFLKYKILSLTPEFAISSDKDCQAIYHARIRKYFWINVPQKLLRALEALKAQGLYTQIAFNVTKITDTIPMMEDMERGEKLKIDLAEMPDISRFYSSESFEDNLSIVHDRSKNSLTFEELRSDYYIAEDKVVNQVVHLEYSITGGCTYITHLDHEFIAYTFEEYEKRLKQSSQKGTAGKVKSFKIDDAMIPFNLKHEGEWFLLIVLDSYFLNHALIQEAFEDLKRASTK